VKSHTREKRMFNLYKLLGSAVTQNTKLGKHGKLGQLVRVAKQISSRTAAGREKAGKTMELLFNIYKELPKPRTFTIGETIGKRKPQLKISESQSKSPESAWQVLTDNIDLLVDQQDGNTEAHQIVKALKTETNAEHVIAIMLLHGAASIISHSNTVGTTSQREILLKSFYTDRNLLKSADQNQLTSLNILEQWLVDLDGGSGRERSKSVLAKLVRRGSSQISSSAEGEASKGSGEPAGNKGLLISLFLDIAYDIYTDMEAGEVGSAEEEESRRLKFESNVLNPVLLGTEHKSSRKRAAATAYKKFSADEHARKARLADVVIERSQRKDASEQCINQQCRLISSAIAALKAGISGGRPIPRDPNVQLKEESAQLAINLKSAVPESIRKNLGNISKFTISGLRAELAETLDGSDENCRFDSLLEKGRLSYTLKAIILQLNQTIPCQQFPSPASVYTFIGNAITEGDVSETSAMILGHEIANMLGVAFDARVDDSPSLEASQETTYYELLMKYPPLDDPSKQAQLIGIVQKAPNLGAEDLAFLSTNAVELGVEIIQKAILVDNKPELLKTLTEIETQDKVKQASDLLRAKGTLGRGNTLFSKVIVAVTAPLFSDICTESVATFCQSETLDNEYKAASKDGYLEMTEPALLGKADQEPASEEEIQEEIAKATELGYERLPEFVDATTSQIPSQALKIFGQIFTGAYSTLIKVCKGKEKDCFYLARQLMLDILFLRQLNTKMTEAAKEFHDKAEDKTTPKENNIKLAAKLLQNVVNRSKLSKETHVTKIQSSEAGRRYRTEIEGLIESLAIQVPGYPEVKAELGIED